MAASTFQLGRLTLREDFTASDTVDADGIHTLNLSGQESMPRWTADGIAKQREDLLSMNNKFVPVVFSGKPYMNGFYRVSSVAGDINDFIPENLKVFAWSASLTLIGTPSSVDVESRLSGAQAKSNNFTSTGERTHAPAIGHNAYWSGVAVPSSMTRATEDGTIKVYRGIPLEVHPRWAISPASYGAGRVRVSDANFERAGVNFSMGPEDWTLSNGLVRVTPNAPGGVFAVSAWDSGVWESKNWDVLTGTGPAVSLGDFDYCTVLRNEFEAVTLRLIKSLAAGRVMVDMTLRRGSRFVELFIQTTTSTTIKIVLVTGVASTNTSGYVRATSNDAAGNQAIVGSAKTFVADTANGGLSKATTLELDAFIGLILGGSGAVSGDAGTDVFEQYIGIPSESVRGVGR